MQVVVHVDGGARGNPGPAAAAAVVSAPDGRVLDESAVTLGHATNNVAEYRALLLGLERAAALGASEVEVVNDSELIARQVDGSYKVRNADLRPLHEQAKAALAGFERWSIRPVPRAENSAADALVNRALDGEEVAPPATAAGDRDGGRDRLRDVPADRRPAATAAAAHAGRARRAAVHRRPPGLRAVVQADPARAASPRATSWPAAARTSRRRGCGASWRSSGCCSSSSACSRRWGRRGSSSSATRSRRPPASSRASSARSSGSRASATPGRAAATRRAGPSLYEAFCAGLGLPEDRERRLAALADLYRDHAGDPLRAAWHDVAELLLDHDEGTARWRHHHALMAAREIGTRPGTGGSPGVEYLKSRVDRRFFPDLWDVRLAL